MSHLFQLGETCVSPFSIPGSNTVQFELLLKKDIPGTVIRLLLDSYYMRWNNCMSTPIKMENGVKQGGVLSPRHYFVYTLMNCCEDYGKLMWAVM